MTLKVWIIELIKDLKIKTKMVKSGLYVIFCEYQEHYYFDFKFMIIVYYIIFFLILDVGVK